MIKINLGSGRLRLPGFINIDIIKIFDGNNQPMIDIILDLEKKQLPFEDNIVQEIRADNIFEHLGDGFIFCLNECHRVLRYDGILSGIVPLAGSPEDFRDPTHKRHFIKETFFYFTGQNLVNPNQPKKPKYSNYQILPWEQKQLEIKENLIYFILTPRK